MRNKYFLNKKAGFTLIEMLVFIFIFSVVSLAFYKVMTVGIQVALDSKNRLGALALASEKMEIARNLQYDDVGTVSGLPNGTISENETVFANGIEYRIKNVIQYVDDNADGSYPEDSVPNDYKKMKVTVSWGSLTGGTKEVSLVSQFVPPGLEVGAGDGVLSIHIINSAGIGIPQARVRIVNNSISPSVDVTQETDDSGSLIFPGAIQSIHSYALTVSKDDYETVSTINPSSVNYSHIDVHASVVAELINTKSVVIDLVSNLMIKSIDQAGAVIPNVGFHLEGGRILGVNNSIIPSETVYFTDAEKSTDSNGESVMEKQGPGQFSITGIETLSGYTLVEINPITFFEETGSVYKFSLLPGESKTVKMKFAANASPGLIVKVIDGGNDLLINEAEVKLTNITGYSKTEETSVDGVAFFPKDEESLINGEYNLEVSASGYQPYAETVEVNNLTSQEVKLDPA